MGDGEGHKLSSCPEFKALSVQERLNEVQKHGLCLPQSTTLVKQLFKSETVWCEWVFTITQCIVA